MADVHEIWLPLDEEESRLAGQNWEHVHAWLEEGSYVIDNVPFFKNDIAAGDVVEAERNKEGLLQFTRVIRSSGRSTFRIWIDERARGELERIRAELTALGCQVEVTLDYLFAIDVPAISEERVWEYLESGKSKGLWDVQVGCSPE